jgi:hypothetical protein
MTEPTGRDDPRAARRAALRRTTLQLVLGVVVLDAVALGIWFLAGIARAPERTRMTFTVIWTIATAITVAILLRRVRRVRVEMPRR